MATIKVTKGWIEQYFGIKIDRPEQYSSYWQTDGGTGTRDFDRLPEDEYEIVHRSSSKTYWGKYVHPTVPPPPFGAEQHTQRRTATYGEADRYKEQIIAGWKAGARRDPKDLNKIIYYAPTANMGETSEINAEKYRNWAKKQLQNKFPDFEIEVSDRENTQSFWTNVDDIHMRDRISMVIHNLWDYCPWNW